MLLPRKRENKIDRNKNLGGVDAIKGVSPSLSLRNGVPIPISMFRAQIAYTALLSIESCSRVRWIRYYLRLQTERDQAAGLSVSP